MLARGMGAALVALVLALPAVAQTTTPDWFSKFSVHGYISQGYAVSDEHQIYGIPPTGTTDYRDMALQFRFDPSRRNAVVLQLRQERFGESPYAEDDVVDLDWAFYQFKLSDRFSLKAGRIPLPLGIFNEAGGAAMTSPFFRPPQEFYRRQYTSRTVDGALGSVSLGGPGAWSFDVDGYFGRWVLEEWGAHGEQADAENAWGGQVWANSPWPGLRIGAGAYRCTVEPAANRSADYVMVHASVDADFNEWRFATEYLTGNLDQYGRYHAWYGQIGYQLTPRFSAHIRGAAAQIQLPSNDHTLEAEVSKDLGLSFNYAIHPSFLFKLEGHTNEGLLREDIPQNLYGTPSQTRYLIASVVASF